MKVNIMFGVLLLVAFLVGININIDRCEANLIGTVAVEIPGRGSIRGKVTGKDGNVRAFYGVPYAEPPVGDLRWRDPRDKLAWNFEFDATNETVDACTQIYQGDLIGTEDCLKLNIWTPKYKKSTNVEFKGFPVMFWIHGGCYTDGRISMETNLYDGKNLVERSGGNVVVVTIQYRLNILGFMGSDKIRKRTRNGSTGNFGIQDQRSAMRWVNSHIKHFNGDPDRVFIFGESAGAGSVSHHLVEEASWQYFHSAGLESGSFAYWVSQSMEFAELQFKALLRQTKCADENCLLKLPADKLVVDATKATEKLEIRHPVEHCPFSPTVDGVELKDFPWVLLSKGSFHRVPVLQGFNRDEGTLDVTKFRIVPGMSEVELGIALTLLGLNETQRITFKKIYPREQFKSAYWQVVALIGDYSQACPTVRSSKLMSDYHRKSHSMTKPKVFLYEFIHVPSFKAPDWAGVHGSHAGVFHSAEIPFVFNDKNEPATHVEKKIALTKREGFLSDVMSKAWIKFATNHEPSVLHWSHFGVDQWSVNLGFPAPYIHPVKRNLASRCSFIESIGILRPHKNKTKRVQGAYLTSTY